MPSSILSKPGFRLIGLIGFTAFLSYDIIRSPLVPLYAKELGADPGWIGIIVGASTLTGVLLKFPSGAISDFLGRPRMLLIGLSVFALAPFGYGWVHEVWQLILLRFFHGLATAVFAPVAMAVVADLFRDSRGEALSWYAAFTQSGRLLGRVAGGYLILGIGFGKTFLVSGGLGILLLLLFLRFKRLLHEHPAALPPKGPSANEMMRGMREVAGDRRILATSAMEAFLMLASGSLMAFLPLYGIAVGLDAGQVGLLFGIQGVSAIFVKPAMGRLSDQLGRRPLIIFGQLICAALMFVFPWIENFWMLLGLSFIFGFGEAVIGSSTSALVADLCQARSLGSAMGVFGTIMDIGHAGGPILCGLLIGLWGYRTGFGGVGVALLIMTTVFLFAVKESGLRAERV